MKGAHGILRAFPGEDCFPALHSTWTRSGEPAPATLCPLPSDPAESEDPGRKISALVSATVRRRPETDAFVLARSEAALLAGEPTPVVALSETKSPGRAPRLITCEWEAPGMGEVLAADLALEDIVRACARRQTSSPAPTVNVFGPPIFGPNAAAEYAEAERLLGLIGVGINARVPLGAGPQDLARLPRAWANLLLYREAGESATLYLQDEFGMQRVTAPMVGAAGTGAALRAIGEVCSLDAQKVERVVWAELATTAKLPWYARLAVPETFRGRRAAVFGDFTYALGLGYTLAREVGLEVALCGTYLKHLERDFLFQAGSFTDEAFVTDDPGEVAVRIKDAEPDLLIGTRLEQRVAAEMEVPFLPLCPPPAEHPFVQRPLMGYAGCGILADELDRALRRSAEGAEPRTALGMSWTDEALEELEEIPAFLRGRARRRAEERARQLRATEVTREILEESRL